MDKYIRGKLSVVGMSICVFVLFVSGQPVLAEKPNKTSMTKIDSPDTVPSTDLADTWVFKPGEKIKLRVSYLGFTAGYITMKSNKTMIDTHQVYKLKVTGKSDGLAYWFYTVNDKFISYVDPAGYFSLGYDYDKNHGGDKESEKVRYDHETGFFFKNGDDTGKISPYTQDVLSAIYFLRAKDLSVGQEYNFPVHLGDESYKLKIAVNAKEKVATQTRGWVESYRIKPSLENSKEKEELQEKLKNGKNGVKLWISADKAKIPLQISIPAKIGTFWGYLSEYKPGGE